ncbi:hypothetical protein CWI75_06770 [Kineobactrum sediminis]|uniref:Uncharacterized protein n=1 Tax=Kineobactrum sediminis TaxID=1905677 RepID=A0A2N5Y3Z5_9GAMM|nr:hypothetical protein [Kineobactrum sediminis]PLW83116.1 hypothetical protein CWI75_06770 [Kineobactrum sediminis]
MDPRYDIVFAGQLLAGHEPATVRARLAQVFKADEATLDKLFSGKPQVLKRNCDKSTALQYKQALERAGAQPVIRQSDTIDAPAVNPAAGAAESQNTAGGLALEPAGSEVLRPDERAGPVATTVSIPPLELAEAGARLAEASTVTVSPPDTSHLTLDIPGDSRAPQDNETSLPVTGGDDIELAAEGTDFSDCASPRPQAPALDLSGLELAPAGVDVLEQRYRAQQTPPPPDTSGLRLEE